MKSRQLRGTYTALVFAALALAWSNLAQAQFFPAKGTLEELDAEAARLAGEQDAADARAAEAQKRSVENAARWKQMQDAVKAKIKAQQAEIGKGDLKILLNDLNKAKAYFRIAEIYFYFGLFSKAEAAIKLSIQNDARSWQVEDGWAYILAARIALGDIMDDDSEFDSSMQKRLESEIKKIRTTLDKVQAEAGQRRRDQRERNFNDFRAWLDKVAETMTERDNLLKVVKEDTFNTQNILRLAEHYHNNLSMWHRRRAWLELLKQHGADSPIVMNGTADFHLAETLVRQGQFSQSQSALNNADNELGNRIGEIEAKMKAIDQKIQEANQKGEEPKLTPEERQTMRMDPNKLREDVRRGMDGARKGVEQRINDIEREAGRQK